MKTIENGFADIETTHSFFNVRIADFTLFNVNKLEQRETLKAIENGFADIEK